jgi:hypothetical protein
MNTINALSYKSRYPATTDENSLIIRKFINLINSNKYQVILQKHTQEAINTVQYYLNTNGYIGDDIIDNIVHTLNYFIRGIDFDNQALNKFIKAIAGYASHTTHYFGGVTKFNWGSINYTKSIANILRDLGATPSYYRWSIEYMKAVLQASSINTNRSALFAKGTGLIVRIAHATSNLNRIVTMYKQGLNFEVIGEFKDHDGFDGVMLGGYNWQYHLEFTHNNNLIEILPEPHPEDAIVFYCKNAENWLQQTKNMENAGFITSEAINPYWSKCGKTFIDCDGHRIILVNHDWTI